MRLSTAGCKAAEGEYYESNVRMLNNICSLLVQPKNTEENELVTDCLKRLKSSLNNAVSEKDRNSYYRILRAAEFFTENLYLPDEPKKQELIAGFYAVLEQELNCAEAYTRACNDLRGVHNEHSITTLREKNRERTQKNLAEADSAVLYYMEYFRGLKGIDEKDMKALKDIYHSLKKQLGEDDQPINGVYTDDLVEDVSEDDDDGISGEWMYDGTRFF